mgnify:FL=1
MPQGNSFDTISSSLVANSDCVITTSSGSADVNNIYWSDFAVQVSQNLCLEKRSDNFLIINNGKTFIAWSSEECRWVEYKINSLEKKFKKKFKKKRV